MTRSVRAAGAAVLLGLAGCAHLEVEERVERGPLLATHSREVILKRLVAAEVELAWPRAEVHVSTLEVCRTERVEVYAEDRIRERRARATGSGVALGAVGTLVGGTLLLGRGVVSAEPDTREIDDAGRYGLSPRQRVTAVGWGALALGLPALGVGIAGFVQGGQQTQTGKVEQVVDARDRRCHPAPAAGALTLTTSAGSPLGPPRSLEGGRVSFALEEAASLLGAERALVDGRPAELLPEQAGRLEAFGQCAAAVAAVAAPASLRDLDLEALRERLFGAQRCAEIPGAPRGNAFVPLKQEAARRHAAE